MTRAPTFLALALAVVAVAPAPASAEVTASADATPSTIAYYGAHDSRTTRTVVHRLRLQAGPEGEHLFVETFERGLSIEGPGVIGERSLGRGHADDFGFPGRDGCPGQAAPFSSETVEVTLPANTTSTLSATSQLDLQRAPLNADAFDLSWDFGSYPVGRPLPNGTYSYPPDFHVVREPPFAFVGLAGSDLVLRAGRRGAAKTIGARQVLSVKPRSRITLRGSITPARPGKPITIWHLAPGVKRVQRLAVVPADPRGRFVYRGFRPARAGRHELYASYAGVRGRTEATRSPCGGPQVLVRRPPA